MEDSKEYKFLLVRILFLLGFGAFAIATEGVTFGSLSVSLSRLQRESL